MAGQGCSLSAPIHLALGTPWDQEWSPDLDRPKSKHKMTIRHFSCHRHLIISSLHTCDHTNSTTDRASLWRPWNLCTHSINLASFLLTVFLYLYMSCIVSFCHQGPALWDTADKECDPTIRWKLPTAETRATLSSLGVSKLWPVDQIRSQPDF